MKKIKLMYSHNGDGMHTFSAGEIEMDDEEFSEHTEAELFEMAADATNERLSIWYEIEEL